MDETLKGCPFCGGVAEPWGGGFVQCSGCSTLNPVAGQWIGTIDVARSAWNRRPIEDALRAERDAAVARAAEATWRPIADAPRDGSQVLLWYPELRLNYSPPRIIPALVAEGFFDVLFDKVWMLSRGNSRIDYHIRTPTHWLPLPAGPKQG